jgi:phenylalanyl-tRNA synthetase alpha chain
MQELLSKLETAIAELKSIDTMDGIENIRITYLGKKGLITQEMQKLGQLSPEQRKKTGQELNVIKTKLLEAIKTKQTQIRETEINSGLMSDAIDITLPAREKEYGTIHPISYVAKEIAEIFSNIGFDSEYGPDIDDDYHNFTALNIPEHHPARDMHDTFYLSSPVKELHLLRTHTSNVQIRKMSNAKPPFRFIAVGRVYRRDSDLTHSPMFHQIEGVCIDKNIDMGHLKGCLQQFITSFFEGKEIDVRFRPSYFPFTEPSAEVDISINGSSWLEVLGCGMVHPNVLKNLNMDPKIHQGFAFGIGLERLAMLKYGIKDCRSFFEGDIRWSKKHSCEF